MYSKHQTQKASGWVTSAILQPNFVDVLDELRIENLDLQVRENLIVGLTRDIQKLFFEKTLIALTKSLFALILPFTGRYVLLIYN